MGRSISREDVSQAENQSIVTERKMADCTAPIFYMKTSPLLSLSPTPERAG